MQAASRTLGLQILVLNATSNDEIDEAFAALVQRGIGALVITPDASFNIRSQQLAALVLRYALPAISAHREFTMAGGLFSYGTSLADIYRQLGIYAAKILRGENPACSPMSSATSSRLTRRARLHRWPHASLLMCGAAEELCPAGRVF